MPWPPPFLRHVVVVSSTRVVVVTSVLVVVGMVVVVGAVVVGIVTVVVGAVVGIVTVVVEPGIVGLGTVLVEVDVVVIEPPELLVVEGWVVVARGGKVVFEPTAVDEGIRGAVVGVVGAAGMGTPIPTAPGIVVVTRASPVVSVGFSTKTPVRSSRSRVVGTAWVVVGLSSRDVSKESTCGGSSAALSTSRSTPAKIPRTRTAAVLRTITPDTSRATRTLSRNEERFVLGWPPSASRAAIRLASSSGLGLRGPVGWGNGQIPFVQLPRPGGSYGLRGAKSTTS
ncbi:MAG TPA: hypothetical protein VF148_06885 [Acidimicrobiia bacterium]